MAPDSEEVIVLERREVMLRPLPGAGYITILILYKAADLPPATVQIAKHKYSTEVESRIIQADIQIRRQQLLGGAYGPTRPGG